MAKLNKAIVASLTLVLMLTGTHVFAQPDFK